MSEGIPPFLDRRPLVWSYTLLNTYEDICPHQAAHRFILKTVPFVETDAMRWGNQVHAAMELRVGGGKPLPESMHQWEHFAAAVSGRGAQCELKLGITADGRACDFFAKDVQGRGKVDVSIIKDISAFITDWKTGNSKYETAFELEIGALLLHALYPHLRRIFGCYVWLKENRMGQLHDLSDTAGTWMRVQHMFARLKADRASGQFAKRQGPLCAYCPVKDCEFNRAVA